MKFRSYIFLIIFIFLDYKVFAVLNKNLNSANNFNGLNILDLSNELIDKIIKYAIADIKDLTIFEQIKKISLINSRFNLLSKSNLINYFKDKNKSEYIFLIFSSVNKKYSVNVLKYLIGIGLDVNSKDSNGNSIIVKSIFCNRNNFLKVLLDNKANINELGVNLKTPLMYCIITNNYQAFKILFESGADLNCRDIEGNNILMVAASHMNKYFIDMLVSTKKFDLNLQNLYGKTTLIILIENIMFNDINIAKDIINNLLKNGANINLPDYRRKNALFYLIKNKNISIDQKLNLLKYLLNNNIDLTANDITGRNILMYLCLNANLKLSIINSLKLYNSQNQVGLLDFILNYYLNKYGKDKFNLFLNSHDNNGDATLFYAVEEGLTDFIDILIKYNVNLNNLNEDGQTALFLAIDYNNFEISEKLLKAGADVNVIDNHGISPLFIAVENGNIDLVKLLLNYGANINYICPNGFNLLMFAIDCNYYNLAQLLLDHGINVNFVNNSNDTALILALSKRANKNFVENLVKKSKNLNVVNSNNETALSIAVENSDFNIVKLLLDHGADVNVGTFIDMPVIFYAISFQNDLIVQLLLSKNLDLNIKYDNKNILEYAKDFKNKKIINMIKEKLKKSNIYFEHKNKKLKFS